ncbi:hypothetical protein [Celeribacter sp.]|uniref:hypothetical protein n=1 Tax=Celeribacter sp. TaxID=1890673 RepID=UPI003A9077D8
MSQRIEELSKLGVLTQSSEASPVVQLAAQNAMNTGANFSGYGSFTPITVGSSTVFGNAHLERSK